MRSFFDLPLGKFGDSSQTGSRGVLRMQDANTTISTARLNELMTAISDARQSFQNWQDQRTEALIRLDAFSFDVQKIEEEKVKLEQRLLEAKKETDAQAKIYQTQIQELTDILQLHKFEIEGFKNSLVAKDRVIEAQKKEMENQKRMKDQLVEVHNTRISELESEYEKRHAETLSEEKSIQEGLSAELIEMSKRKADVEVKIEKLERELNHIRSHMIGLLHPKSVTAAAAAEKSDHIDPFSETHTIRTTPNSGAATVDDYLKRLGY